MVIPFGAFQAVGGIAIFAAEQAGVIGTDVLAGDAAAGLALGGVFFRVHLQSEGPRNVAVVNAFTGKDAVGGEIDFLGATEELHVVFQADAAQGLHQVGQSGALTELDFNALFLQRLQPIPGFAVEFHQADDAAGGITLQGCSQFLKCLLVEFDWGAVGEHNGIITPDHFLGTDQFGELFETFQAVFNSRSAQLQPGRVIQ